MDWFVGGFCGYDMFIPWNNVDFCFATSQQGNFPDFIENAKNWQKLYVNEIGGQVGRTEI